MRARHEVGPAARELADAQLRPLQINQHAERVGDLAFDLAHQLIALAMILVGTVAEIEPEHIGASLDQRANRLRGAGGGPQGGQDLRFAISSHWGRFTRMTLKSLTLVRVGPVTTRSSMALKNP